MKKKPKKLSEIEAWELMARKWSRPIIGWIGAVVRMKRRGGLVTCLCDSIRELRDGKLISSATRDAMRLKISTINRHVDINCSLLWPRDAAGAKQRADFCLEQAKKLRAKEKKK